MDSTINQIKTEYLNKITSAKSLLELDQIFLELFGKTGKLTILPKQFSQLDRDQLKIVGPLFNQTKIELENNIENKRSEVREAGYKTLESEQFDLTQKIEVEKIVGHLHPITQFESQIAQMFRELGFEQYDAPHIDTDFNNFEQLNIPQNHPARDLWDTLYIDGSNLKIQTGKLLLRTHTSNSQIHIMEEFKPPIRLMNIGRCFRYENLDARHEHTFEQFELVYIDKGLNMGNLQFLSEYLLKKIFGSDIKVRLKPGYYPFVEPGAKVEGECIFCKGVGCKICGGVGWLELAGAGMIHPTVLKNGGVNPDEYSGIAWGFGVLRVAMLKFGATDVRTFASGDLKALGEIKI